MADPRIYVVRNEVDQRFEYHCDALADRIPTAEEVDFVAGDEPPLDRADGLVLTGSTAGVYEFDERPWIDEQARLIRAAVTHEIPTLGVCFGHQIANYALGGTVEHVGWTSRLVKVSFADEPLFDGLSPIVPAVHGDMVTIPADRMDVIASTDHDPAFGTKHRAAPLWTVQFHPEFDASLRPRLEADFDWTETEYDFSAVNAHRVFDNFFGLVETFSKR